MTFRTNAVKVQAFAGALFGVQVGTTTMAQVNADIAANGGLAATLNSYYSATFGGATTASVAATVAANLGLTGDALASGSAYIAAQLNGAAAGARGAVISNIVNLFGTLSADTTFGAAATAWNAKVATAVSYTGATNVAVGTEVVPTGSVFILTSGADILDPTNATAANKSTAGNDTFRAAETGLLGSADYIDGGAGNDTLTAAITANSQTIAPAILNVEQITLTVTAADTKSFTFNATDVTNANVISVSNAGAASMSSNDERITVSNLAKTTSLGIVGGTAASGTTASEITATWKSAAAADTQKVAISAAGQTALLTLSTAETVEISATGTGTTGANTIGSLAATAVKNLNIVGSGDLTISASDLAAAVTVNATAAAGKISFTGETAATSTTFSGGAGATTLATASTGVISITTGAADDVITLSGASSTATVNAGAGNDRVSIGAASTVTAADAIAGGEGTDTLAVSDATINATTRTTLALGVTGFELLETTATGAVSIDYNALSTYDNVRLSGAMGASTGGSNAGAGDVSVSVTTENTDVLVIAAARQGGAGGAGSAGSSVGGNGGDGITITPRLDNGSNVANLNFIGNADIAGGAGGAAVGSFKGGAGGDAVDASSVETLNITVTGTVIATGTADVVTLTAGASGGSGGTSGTAGDVGETMKVGTNATINITSALEGATAALHNGLDLGTVKGTNVTVNASAFKGNLTVTAADGNVTINGGDGRDALTGGAGTDVINGGAGADTLNGMAGADVYTGGAGRDIFVISDSGTTAFDTVSDFGLVTTALTAAQVGTLSATNAFGVSIAAATTLGGAATDLLDVADAPTFATASSANNVASASGNAGSTITANISAKGVITLGGGDAALVNTLAEWVGIANALAGTTHNVAVFEFGGSTYVFQQNTTANVTDDALVQLVGVTGVTGAVVAGGSVAAAVGDIFII
jgi:hypothetical protein